MITARVVTIGGRALLRSRLIRPPGPRALVRVANEVRRGGTNPFTLLAVGAARWPDRAAMIDDEGSISYAQLQTTTEVSTDSSRSAIWLKARDSV